MDFNVANGSPWLRIVTKSLRNRASVTHVLDSLVLVLEYAAVLCYRPGVGGGPTAGAESGGWIDFN